MSSLSMRILVRVTAMHAGSSSSGVVDVQEVCALCLTTSDVNDQCGLNADDSPSRWRG